MQLTGVYEIINWQETTEKQFDDGAKLSKAVVSLSYEGEIEAVAKFIISFTMPKKEMLSLMALKQ